MQYILSEQEFNRGCPLMESWETEDMTLDCAYIEQENLNNQGYFTVIHCSDVEKDLHRIKIFQKK